MGRAMRLPDWRTLTLDDDVRVETVSDQGRIVLWVPEVKTGRRSYWSRVHNVGEAPIVCAAGLCAVQAIAITTQIQPGGVLSKLFSWFRKSPEAAIWYLPDGQPTLQRGGRRTDLLLGWPGDQTSVVDEGRIRGRIGPSARKCVAWHQFSSWSLGSGLACRGVKGQLYLTKLSRAL